MIENHLIAILLVMGIGFFWILKLLYCVLENQKYIYKEIKKLLK